MGMIWRVSILLLVSTLALVAADFNAVVLRQVEEMPVGGGYATTTSAHEALASAASFEPAGLKIRSRNAMPSYCSGATYLVLLKTLGALQRQGVISLDRATWTALLPGKVPDGVGVWGRWNANGPGTPRLFYELGLGRNFTAFSEAKAGDFLKIFWTDEVGRNERGHSVIFLGIEERDGVEHVRFWSSNKPGGYGEKSVPRAKIARVIFSRLEVPGRIAGARQLPGCDAYLAGLLTKRSSFEEASRLSGVR